VQAQGLVRLVPGLGLPVPGLLAPVWLVPGQEQVPVREPLPWHSSPEPYRLLIQLTE